MGFGLRVEDLFLVNEKGELESLTPFRKDLVIPLKDDGGAAQLTNKAAQIRVAIIGSGPSGFYAADHLLKQSDPEIAVDMYERLPTPFGLVRGGVAPRPRKDQIRHQTLQSHRCTRALQFPSGNIEFGTDLSRHDLSDHYHGIIYAVGAQTDRKLGIAGEDTLNSYAATEFVGWYNGHPDYQHYDFDLTGIKRVAVIGVGNVAMDVARILARTPEELYGTDIADYALNTLLRRSEVEEIYILGRRGPAQAAFTNPEIKELGEMADADIIVDCDDASLDELSATHLKKARDRSAIRNVKILQSYVDRGLTGKSRRIIMRFLVSPCKIIGREKVKAMKIVKNELYLDDNGNLRPARNRRLRDASRRYGYSAQSAIAACRCLMCHSTIAGARFPTSGDEF